MLKLSRNTLIFSALALLMAATRYNHFGTAVSLPDASLAVFFLGGLYLARSGRAAWAAFAFMLLEAWGMDYYATAFRGVSDWCITPAYSFLILTYASLWQGGRWLAHRLEAGQAGIAQISGSALISVSLAFLISNVSFYLLAGYFAEMTAGDYAAAVAQYYLPYLASAALYLAPAAALHLAISRPTALTHA